MTKYFIASTTRYIIFNAICKKCGSPVKIFNKAEPEEGQWFILRTQTKEYLCNTCLDEFHKTVLV